MLIIQKSDPFDKVKWDFFQAVAMSVLQYCCTIWTVAKCLEKKLDGSYTRTLCTILNKFWKQHHTKQQLYGHLTFISQTIQVRWIRLAWHSWRSKVELISDILLWTSPHGHLSVIQPAKTSIHQFYADTGCRLEDLPGTMNDRDGWGERS